MLTAIVVILVSSPLHQPIVRPPAPITALAPANRADSTRAEGSRWALALSGGLARGVAHIGVLRAIEEEGICPDVIVGTSMGSLIGALWASGRSSADLAELFRTVDAQSLFESDAAGLAWRGHLVPRAWFTLVGHGGLLRLPPGMLDDANLNDLVARHLLTPDAIAQGDFDRLPVPWRAVATEMETFGPVVLDTGSVALAVRSSISIPVVFPSVWREGQLLVDGGMSSHLPMLAARADSAAHVLGIDVAPPQGPFDHRTSALRIASATFQLMSQRGRTDARPGRDEVIWLRMPGVSPADFRLVDTLIARGYRESRDTIAALARAWRLPRVRRPVTRFELPPLAEVRWTTDDGRTARASAAATDLAHPLPAGRFAPDSLAPALARIHRGDLFLGVWPRFRSDGDSTRLEFEVHEHEPAALAGTLAYDTDDGGRFHADLLGRPRWSRRVMVARAGGVYRRFARGAFVSIEPRSLARGAMGAFVRGGARRTDTRVFARDGGWRLERTDRLELLAGGQLRLPSADVLQAGAGVGRTNAGGWHAWAPMAALRVETRGRRPRHLDAVALGGERRYAAVRAGAALALPFPWATLRPGASLGWASNGAPVDEWPALGGPRQIAGLRRAEWLGRRAAAIELRAVRHLTTGVEAHAAVEAARVERVIGGPTERVRFGVEGGVRADVPFGPLSIDAGLGEGGRRRLYVGIGQEF